MIQQPNQWDQLSETARHREVLSIAHTDNVHTRPYNQIGRHHKGEVEENWVARWVVWHAFRYCANRLNSSAMSAERVRSHTWIDGTDDLQRHPRHFGIPSTTPGAIDQHYTGLPSPWPVHYEDMGRIFQASAKPHL